MDAIWYISKNTAFSRTWKNKRKKVRRFFCAKLRFSFTLSWPILLIGTEMTIVFSTYFSPSLLLSPHFLPDHLDISIGDLDLIVFEKSSGGKKGLLSGARARALFSTWVVENWLFARWLNGSWQKVLLLCKGSEFSSEIQSDEGRRSSKIAQKMLTELQFYCLKFWVKFWKKVFPNVSLPSCRSLWYLAVSAF